MNRLLEHLLIHSFSKLLTVLFTVLFVLILVLTYLGFFESMEDRFIDLRFQTRPILNNRLPVSLQASSSRTQSESGRYG